MTVLESLKKSPTVGSSIKKRKTVVDAKTPVKISMEKVPRVNMVR